MNRHTSRLTGSVAVVTGGASGLGQAIAVHLAGRGATVALLDVDRARAESVALDIRERGGNRALAVAADVSDEDSVVSAFDRVTQELGELDVLVNCAGINVDASIRNLTLDDWERTLAINLTGVMLCSRSAATLMIPMRSGRIVNVASRAWLGWWGQVAYASSKGGVISATRSLAIELARYGISVNCVAPGLIDTPLVRREPQETLDRLLKAQPNGRMGAPEDVAGGVALFAEMTRPVVTGQVLYVCGGKSLYARPAVRNDPHPGSGP